MKEQDQIQIQKEKIQLFMKIALEQAQTATKVGQIPVGCVFIKKQENEYLIVARNHNRTNQFQNASRHCEINCFLQMQSKLSPQQIQNCILLVTVQPCIMCTHALNIMGIKNVYFGLYNDKFGGCGSVRKDNKFKCTGGILQKESAFILKNFYESGNQKLPQQQRHRKNKKIKSQN